MTLRERAIAETRAGMESGANQRGLGCGVTSNDCWRRAIGRWSVGTCAPDAGGDLYDALAALLMHGNEADPVFSDANRTAQGLWGLTWDEFIRLPSRLSAEPLIQAERDGLLARVRAHGFIDDYQGVRIAKDGTRFRISSAMVWTVVVEGRRMGRRRYSGSGRRPEPGPRFSTVIVINYNQLQRSYLRSKQFRTTRHGEPARILPNFLCGRVGPGTATRS